MTQPTTATNRREEHRLSKLGLETVGAWWGYRVGRFPCSMQRWLVPAATLAQAPSPQLLGLLVLSQPFGLPACWRAAGQAAAPAAAGAWWRFARKPGKTLVCAGAAHTCRCMEKKTLLFHKSCFGSAGDWQRALSCSASPWDSRLGTPLPRPASTAAGRGERNPLWAVLSMVEQVGPIGSQSWHYTVEPKRKNTFPILVGNTLAPAVLWAQAMIYPLVGILEHLAPCFSRCSDDNSVLNSLKVIFHFLSSLESIHPGASYNNPFLKTKNMLIWGWPFISPDVYHAHIIHGGSKVKLAYLESKGNIRLNGHIESLCTHIHRRKATAELTQDLCPYCHSAAARAGFLLPFCECVDTRNLSSNE